MRDRRHGLLLLTVLTLLLAACRAPGTAAPDMPPIATTATTSPVAATVARATPTGGPSTSRATASANDTLPPGCETRQGLVRVVAGFLEAFNRGDQDALARSFPVQAAGGVSNGRSDQFQWYSVTEGDPRAGGHNVTLRSRADLLAYFVQRHEQHERLEIRSLQVNGTSGRNSVDFQYTLTRVADDLPERPVDGKGAINCDNQTIFVWSMGNP